jgi:hypothetical protein
MFKDLLFNYGPTESLIMALLFLQHKLIEWLEGQISKPKISVLKPLDQ